MFYQCSGRYRYTEAAGIDNICVVGAQFVGNDNYQPSGYVAIATVNINKGEQSFPDWKEPYGSANPIATYGSTLSVQNPEPAGQGSVEYQVASESSDYCTINTGSGTVTPTSAGAGHSCVVKAQFSGNTKYGPSGYVTIATISIE